MRKQRASHGMLTEGGCLVGMAGEAGRIADLANIGVNVAIGACVGKARVNARLFCGSVGRQRFVLLGAAEAGENPHDGQEAEGD